MTLVLLCVQIPYPAMAARLVRCCEITIGKRACHRSYCSIGSLGLASEYSVGYLSKKNRTKNITIAIYLNVGCPGTCFWRTTQCGINRKCLSPSVSCRGWRTVCDYRINIVMEDVSGHVQYCAHHR